MKKIVVYSSSTGFTEKYAKLIANELKCSAVRYKEMTKNMWEETEFIIYGGGIMAGMIKGFDKLKKNSFIKGRQLVVFAVGATGQNSEEKIDKIKKDNLIEEDKNKIKFFYMEGGINYEKMGFMPKMMLKMMYKSIKNKSDKTEEETDMVKMFEKSSDNTSIEYIKPLVEYVKMVNI